MRSKHMGGPALVSVVWKRLFIGLCAVCVVVGAAACAYKFTDIRYLAGGGLPMALITGTSLTSPKRGISAVSPSATSSWLETPSLCTGFGMSSSLT